MCLGIAPLALCWATFMTASTGTKEIATSEQPAGAAEPRWPHF